MTPIALLALLGLTLFLPILLDDEDDNDVVDPVDPENPAAAINGTNGPDALTAQSSETVNGRLGDDVLSTAEGSDGARIEGAAGNDTLDLFGTNATARGGAGDDVIFSFDILNGVVEGGDGDDTITFQPLTPQAGDPDTDTSRVDGGAGDDSIVAFGIGGVVSGGEGDDLIAVQGSLERVDGGAGNDTIFADSADYGGGTPVFGGAGDDLITLTNSPGFQIGSDANGGDGNDTISTTTYLDSSGTTFDTLTGGTGADTFELAFNGTNETNSGVVTTITDFRPGFDFLVFRGDDPDTADTLISDVTLTEAPDGSFTDVSFRTDGGGEGAGAPSLSTVRLLGVTGVTMNDIALGDGSRVTEGTAGDDTLSSNGNDNNRFDGIDTLRGLAGDDVLIHSGSDDAAPLVLEGGEGNDTLIANEVEFRNATTLDGGAGDDVLRTDIFVGGGGGGFETFITGDGTDRIEITTFNVTSSESIDLGLLGVVTDFTVGEDMIFVDPSQLVREVFPQDGANGGEDFIAEYEQEFSLREDPDGALTDLAFTFTAVGRLVDGEPVQMTGVIRLEGLTGITEDDIAFSQLETQAPLFVRDGVFSGS